MLLLKLLIVSAAALLWLYACFEAAQQFGKLDVALRALVVLLLIISIISLIGVIWDTFSTYFRNKNDALSLQNREAKESKSASFEMYTNVEHSDIYRVVSDKTLQQMYPGIQTKEPSMHHTEIETHVTKASQSMNRNSSFWNSLYKRLTTRRNSRNISTQNAINPYNSERKTRDIPPPPARAKRVAISPPPTRNLLLPPPPPRNTAHDSDNEVIVNLYHPQYSTPVAPVNNVKDVKDDTQLKKTKNALLKDIDKVSELRECRGNSVKQISNRQSLLQQIEQGTNLRKSTLTAPRPTTGRFSVIMKEMDELTPWDHLSKQMKTRRQFFCTQDDDLRSNFSGRSSFCD